MPGDPPGIDGNPASVEKSHIRPHTVGRSDIAHGDGLNMLIHSSDSFMIPFLIRFLWCRKSYCNNVGTTRWIIFVRSSDVLDCRKQKMATRSRLLHTMEQLKNTFVHLHYSSGLHYQINISSRWRSILLLFAPA